MIAWPGQGLTEFVMLRFILSKRDDEGWQCTLTACHWTVTEWLEGLASPGGGHHLMVYKT